MCMAFVVLGPHKPNFGETLAESHRNTSCMLWVKISQQLIFIYLLSKVKKDFGETVSWHKQCVLFLIIKLPLKGAINTNKLCLILGHGCLVLLQESVIENVAEKYKYWKYAESFYFLLGRSFTENRNTKIILYLCMNT